MRVLDSPNEGFAEMSGNSVDDVFLAKTQFL